jgi:multidrug resistance efflux pump
VGPKHTVWKIAGVLALAALIFVSVYEKTYRVGAEAVLQPRTKRIVATPFDGIIESLAPGLEPGLEVKEGDLLVQLDTTDLRYSREEVLGKIAQAEAQESAALQEKKADEAARARAQRSQAEAQLKFINDRIERSTIKAPIAGKVTIGELKNKVGAAIKLGDPLLEISDMTDIIVVAQVDDRDIWLVRTANQQGTKSGSILAKASPTTPYPLEVETIVPLAQAKEGKNTFEVRAKLLQPTEPGAPPLRDIQPGMEGIANLDTQRHSLMWIGSRRVIDAVRLWLW